ncbi:MAG: type II secretion system protein [Fervidobacterium sp.]
MGKSGYTLSEVLVVLIIISIFFAILVSITDSTLKSYQITRATLQTLYAQSYVDFLFDVLEGELKWTGSGSTLLMREGANAFSNDGKLLKPDGTVYTEITDKLWLYNSLDIEKTTTGFAIYVTYILPSPVMLKYDTTTKTYRPTTTGYLLAGWCILKNAISPSAPTYTPRYAKLLFYKNGAPVNSLIQVSPTDSFIVKEIASTNPPSEIVLNPESSDPKYKNYFYIVPIARFKNTIFNFGYTTKTFRQVKIEYNSQTKEITMTRFLPSTDLSQNTYTVKLLDNVTNFEGSLVYYSSGNLAEIRFDNRDDWNTYKYGPAVRSIKDYIVGIKFTVNWEAPWKNLSKNDAILTKTRLIIIPKAIQ